MHTRTAGRRRRGRGPPKLVATELGGGPANTLAAYRFNGLRMMDPEIAGLVGVAVGGGLGFLGNFVILSKRPRTRSYRGRLNARRGLGMNGSTRT